MKKVLKTIFIQAIILSVFGILLLYTWKKTSEQEYDFTEEQMDSFMNSDACLSIDTLYNIPDTLSRADSILLQRVHLDSLYELSEESKEISYIFIHCTATPPKSAKNLDSLQLMNIFKERGWDRSGYQFFIDYKGIVFQMVDLKYNDRLSYNEMSWGAAGYNDRSIHISYAGGVDDNLKPEDTRTYSQKLTLINLVKVLKHRYPNATILPHSAVSKKACPSFDVYTEFH